MEYKSMQINTDALWKRFGARFAVAVALVIVLALGGALGVALQAEKNTLGDIQLVQENDAEFEDGEFDFNESEEVGSEVGEYPPELEPADESEAAQDEDEAEGEQGGADTDAVSTPSSAAQGDEAEINASAPRNTTFDFFLNGVRVGSGRSNAAGELAAAIRIPLNARLGQAILTLKPRTAGLEALNTSFNITAPGQTRMGSISVGVAVLLVLAGGLFTIVRRRRAGHAPS